MSSAACYRDAIRDSRIATTSANKPCKGARHKCLYNSNLSNSDRSADEKDDWVWKTDVRIGNGLQLSRDVRLNLAADLRGQVWDRFDAFDKIGTGTSAGLRYRFRLGRQTPWILLEKRIGYDHFHDSELAGFLFDVNVARRMIADKPFDDVTATSNSAHTLTLLGTGIDCRS